MPVEPCPQPLLVEEMGNQTNTSTKDEQAVEDTHLEVVLSLLAGEGTTIANQIDEAHSNAPIDIENEVILFGSRHRLDG